MPENIIIISSSVINKIVILGVRKAKEILTNKTYLVFCICLISTSVFSQTVTITAKLIDYNTKRYVNQGIVVNKSSNFGFFVDLDGTFTTQLNLKDTLLISINYMTTLK